MVFFYLPTVRDMRHSLTVEAAVFNGGMKTSVFVFYRQLIGAIVMVPLALIFER
jgi:type IV secretory pathway VirB3-like protein